jgi:DNA-binding winged helix-turn-helix (wHTH) protein
MSALFQDKWQESVVEDEGDHQQSISALGFGKAGAFQSCQDLGPREFRFGRWCLVPSARLLLRNGEPVDVGSRAFDLLHLLLCRRGVVVEKAEIVRFVWPTTIVEESNLRFQMAALRKALGMDGSLIKTIPGRGYIFTEDYRAA